MKLLGSTKDTTDADKNSENVPKLEKCSSSFSTL